MLPVWLTSPDKSLVPKWRNWQTRVVQVHVLARVWGFESLLRHQIHQFMIVFARQDVLGLGIDLSMLLSRRSIGRHAGEAVRDGLIRLQLRIHIARKAGSKC